MGSIKHKIVYKFKLFSLGFGKRQKYSQRKLKHHSSREEREKETIKYYLVYKQYMFVLLYQS